MEAKMPETTDVVEESTDTTSESTVEANDKMHKHLSTVFVIVGIVSFTLGAIVYWYNYP